MSLCRVVCWFGQMVPILQSTLTFEVFSVHFKLFQADQIVIDLLTDRYILINKHVPINTV